MSASVEGDWDLLEWTKELRNDVDTIHKSIAKLFYKYQADDDIGSVPVDTGRFRASWNSSRGEKDLSHPDVSDNGPFDKPEFDVGGSITDGETIHLTNAIPYGVKLNAGHVSQIPERFFERNFQSALNALDAGFIREQLS